MMMMVGMIRRRGRIGCSAEGHIKLSLDPLPFFFPTLLSTNHIVPSPQSMKLLLLALAVRIKSEQVVEVDVHSCVGSSFTNPRNAYSPLPTPSDLDWCLRIRSDKKPNDLDTMRRKGIEPEVEISWVPGLDNGPKCRFTVRGYQEEYWLSPDYGSFQSEECKKVAGEHKGLLDMGNQIPSRKTFHSNHSSCPLLRLPLDPRVNQACTLLQPRTWYILSLNFRNSRLFRYPFFTLPFAENTNLIQVETSSDVCKASVLTLKTPNFPLPLFITLEHQEKHYKSSGGSVVISREEFLMDLWKISKVEMRPNTANMIQQICATAVVISDEGNFSVPTICRKLDDVQCSKDPILISSFILLLCTLFTL